MRKPVAAKFKFVQDGDSCGGEETQDLTVEVDDAGGGCFVILKTDRWALDLDELQAFIDRLKWCAEQCQ